MHDSRDAGSNHRERQRVERGARRPDVTGAGRRRPEKTAEAVRVGRFTVGRAHYAVISLPRVESPPLDLTTAELEVALLLAAGATNAEIARARGTSARTVSNQVARILAKLGVAGRRAVAGRLLQDPEIARSLTASRWTRKRGRSSDE